MVARPEPQGLHRSYGDLRRFLGWNEAAERAQTGETRMDFRDHRQPDGGVDPVRTDDYVRVHIGVAAVPARERQLRAVLVLADFDAALVQLNRLQRQGVLQQLQEI